MLRWPRVLWSDVSSALLSLRFRWLRWLFFFLLGGALGSSLSCYDQLGLSLFMPAQQRLSSSFSSSSLISLQTAALNLGELPGTRDGWLPRHIRYDLSGPRSEALRSLALHYLEPWTPVDRNASTVSRRMLDVMETVYNRTAFRVLVVQGRLYFRHLQYFSKPFQYERMTWLLRCLRDMLAEGLITVELDLLISIGSGPSVAVDTSMGDDAGFPLFSLRTSTVHADIAIPHPMTYGAHGGYVWAPKARFIPWHQRIPRAAFFGKATCFPMQADNWHACPRVHAAQIAVQHPELMDVGITKWHLAERRAVLYPMSRVPEIERSTGLNVTKPRTWEDQAAYKYIMDIDGDVGSSRKPGILTSGSVLLAQRSGSYNYFEPLLEPRTHFIPVEQWFSNLPAVVRWCQDNDAAAHEIQRRGAAFAERFLSLDAAKEYLAILLLEYSRLLAFRPTTEPVYAHNCTEREMDSMAGCSWDWMQYNGTVITLPSAVERRQALDRRKAAASIAPTATTANTTTSPTLASSTAAAPAVTAFTSTGRPQQQQSSSAAVERRMPTWANTMWPDQPSTEKTKRDDNKQQQPQQQKRKRGGVKREQLWQNSSDASSAAAAEASLSAPAFVSPDERRR